MSTITTGRPPVPPCPRCQGADVVRNGPDRAGTPTFRCRGCGRRFVREPRTGPVPDDRKDLIRRLLAERLALRAIARVTGVSRSWLQRFVNALYRDHTPHHPGPPPKRPARS